MSWKFLLLFCLSSLALMCGCKPQHRAQVSAAEREHIKMCLLRMYAIMFDCRDESLSVALYKLAEKDDGKYVNTLEGFPIVFNPDETTWMAEIRAVEKPVALDKNEKIRRGENVRSLEEPRSVVNPDKLALYHARGKGDFLAITFDGGILVFKKQPSFEAVYVDYKIVRSEDGYVELSKQ